MSKFKKGDKVIAVATCDGAEIFIGQTGRVIKIRNNYECTLTTWVRFYNKRCEWWCEESSLRLLSDYEDEETELYV